MHLTNLIRQMQTQNSKLKIQSFGGPNSNVLIRSVWMIWVIQQVIVEHLFHQRFDLIHVHSIPAMVSGKILSLILGIPVLVTVHGYNVKRWMEKFILTKIKYDEQITVARNFLAVPNVNKNVVYIPNGIDLERYKNIQKGIKKYEKKKVVLFVGRKNDPVKGFSILLRAFELVKKEVPQAKLLVAGGDLSSDEVSQMYHRANLFVLPSLSEGFPLTLLEAWATKLPVVATGVGDLPYLIKDGVNGYLSDPGSAQKLSVAIIKALKNRNLAKLGENGYNQAKEYTWEKTARETIKVYQKICLKY